MPKQTDELWTVPINIQTLMTMGKMFDFIIHGDKTVYNMVHWDLEFPDMFKAVAFAQMMREFDYYINIRVNDSVPSLYECVSLTLFVKVC